MDEFAEIAKCELEIATLDEHLHDGSHGKEEVHAALQQGVRLNRSESVIGNMKLQVRLRFHPPCLLVACL
jgi:hypothetical protein